MDVVGTYGTVAIEAGTGSIDANGDFEEVDIDD